MENFETPADNQPEISLDRHSGRYRTEFEQLSDDYHGRCPVAFGLGIHRCIGSNVARATFKTMLTAVLDRLPDFVCDPAGAVHYDTVGVINGMKKLPATFTPGKRLGIGLDETIDRLQRICDEQRLAEPVTVRAGAAKLDA